MGIPDCIVIGGGVVGLTIARRLAQDGLGVTLFDRGVVGGEASWAGAGILSPGNPHRDDPLFHFQEESLSLFPKLCEQLVEQTGIDPEYDRCGELQLMFSPDVAGIGKSIVRVTSDRTMPDGSAIYLFHEPEAVGQVEQMVTPKSLGGLECRQTAVVRNPRLLRALHESCKTSGVTIRQNTKVTGLIAEKGTVRGVSVGADSVHAGHVVLAAGAWSSQLMPTLEALMPVHPVRGEMILMKFDTPPFRRVISAERNYLVPRRDGHVLLGATEERAGFNKRNTARGISSLIEKGLTFAPMLADAPIKASWAGLRPGTPDEKPYLGPVPGYKGLIAATGHFRSGLTLAPATAEFVSALIQKRSYQFDLTSCLPGRA